MKTYGAKKYMRLTVEGLEVSEMWKTYVTTMKDQGYIVRLYDLIALNILPSGEIDWDAVEAAE